MSNFVRDVAEFHQVVLNQPQLSPDDPWANLMVQRRQFLEEEIAELGHAIYKEDLVDVTDALIDMIYVAIGTLYIMGVPISALWDVVHQANMQKKRGMTKRGVFYDACKPLGWVPPEGAIERILESYGYETK
jgi:predicted HAD superfamily Cof-like phosphohydrolase